MPPVIVLLGAAVSVWGGASYVRDTLRGRTKPNRMTWLVWAVAPLIATAAAVVDGVGWAVLPVFMAGFGPLLIFGASFLNPQAYWRLTTFDYGCGACSILALVLWGVTKEPSVAIVLAIVSDGLAGIPTLKKAWHHPETESWAVYGAGAVNALTGLAVVQAWVFSEYGFAAFLVVVNSVLLYAVCRRRGHRVGGPI